MKTHKYECFMFCVILQIIYLTNILYSMQTYREWGKVSTSDIAILNGSPRLYGLIIVPIIGVLFLYFGKIYGKITYIIKFSSRKSIYKRQLKTAFAVAIAVGIYHYISQCLWGVIISSTLINWTKSDSLFFSINKTITNISFIRLSIYYVLGVILTTYISLSIIILCSWNSKKWLGIFLVIACAGINFAQNRIPTIFRGVIPTYNSIINGEAMIYFLVKGIAIAVILTMVGIYYCERKEFINEL